MVRNKQKNFKSLGFVKLLYLTNNVKKRAITVRARERNDSDLVEVRFMSYQQWAEIWKLHHETVMKKVCFHQLTASPVFRWRKKWKIASTERSITYGLQPIRAGYHSDDNGGSQYFRSTLPSFWSIIEDDSWLSNWHGTIGDVRGNRLPRRNHLWLSIMQKNELYRNCPISVTFHSCQQSRRLTTGNPNKEKASLPYNNHLIMYAKHSSCHD